MPGKTQGTGWGCIAPVAFPTAVGSRFLAREIQSPSSGAVEIRSIVVTTIQQAGTTSPAFASWYVVRCEKNADPVEASATSVLPGIPVSSDLGSLELLAAGYVELRSQEPIQFGDRELRASGGSKLLVVMTGIVDGSVVPPTLNQAVNGSLTVLGVDIATVGAPTLKPR